MVPYIKELAVGRKAWLDEQSFRAGVVLCQTIPGATAMQAAAYVGLRVRGILGGLAAYIGFGLPAFLLMLVLTAIYLHTRELPVTTSLFAGLRVVVVAIVANATVDFGRSSIKRVPDGVIAALAAVALAPPLKMNPIAVIVICGVLGCLLLKEEGSGAGPGAADPWRAIRPALLLVALGAVAIAALYGLDSDLFALTTAMLRVDLFAFGGGFASAPLMHHEVVNVHGWMDARTFLDGMALGQVTPGPLAITATFVGYLVKGFLGATVATIGVFAPSFGILALVLPVFDRLQTWALFRRAMRGALLAFVGLLAATTVRFSFDVSWSLAAALIGIAAFTALRRKVDIIWVVLAAGLLSALFL